MIWEKFLCNVTLSAPCAAFDVTVGELMANPEAWEVALGCTSEAYRLGVAKGVPFSFDDPLRYVTDFAATIPNASPSMRLDHLARRPSEIDVINGQVVELSRELGSRRRTTRPSAPSCAIASRCSPDRATRHAALRHCVGISGIGLPGSHQGVADDCSEMCDCSSGSTRRRQRRPCGGARSAGRTRERSGRPCGCRPPLRALPGSRHRNSGQKELDLVAVDPRSELVQAAEPYLTIFTRHVDAHRAVDDVDGEGDLASRVEAPRRLQSRRRRRLEVPPRSPLDESANLVEEIDLVRHRWIALSSLGSAILPPCAGPRPPAVGSLVWRSSWEEYRSDIPRFSPWPGYVGSMGDVPTRQRDDEVAWGIQSHGESRWPALLAVLAAMGLQLILPNNLLRGLGNRALIPSLEGVLLLVLLIANPGRISKEESRLRIIGIALIALITVANVVSLIELIHTLLYPTGGHAGGRSLVYASVPIWLTNVIVFGLWYWELDRGGPATRQQPQHRQPDFLFPQMSTPGSAPGWTPDFLDYLYTSFTNATAFSPTDTMPLTAWAKLLMMLQSLASLVTVAVVVSRAVNILS